MILTPASYGMQDLKIIVLDECLDECLDEKTGVWITRGGVISQIPISELVPTTDLIKSVNIIHEEIQWVPFSLMDRGVRDSYSLNLSNGENIICTATHKWYVKDTDGKTTRRTLADIISSNITEILSFHDNALKSIRIISITKLDKPHHVYDLSVVFNHNFFIGNSETLTSNSDRLTVPLNLQKSTFI